MPWFGNGIAACPPSRCWPFASKRPTDMLCGVTCLCSHMAHHPCHVAQSAMDMLLQGLATTRHTTLPQSHHFLPVFRASRGGTKGEVAKLQTEPTSSHPHLLLLPPLPLLPPRLADHPICHCLPFPTRLKYLVMGS